MCLGNKKGTFDIKIAFTPMLACTKKALFITKKGTFSPLKNCFWRGGGGGGGGGHVPPMLPVPTPLGRNTTQIKPNSNYIFALLAPQVFSHQTFLKSAYLNIIIIYILM
jgi:hypothetical protein